MYIAYIRVHAPEHILSAHIKIQCVNTYIHVVLVNTTFILIE